MSRFVSKPKFKIRTLLWAIAFAAVIAAYVGTVLRRGVKHKELVSSLHEVGVIVAYDHGPSVYQTKEMVEDSWLQVRLRDLFGDEHFGSVKQLGISSQVPNSPVPRTVIEKIHAFPRLTHLTLVDFKITIELVESISSLRQLRSIEFYRCDFDDLAVTSLRSLDRIESLSLMDPSVNDRIMDHLPQMKRLQELRLYSTELVGNIPNKLQSLPGLSSLMISGMTMSNQDFRVLAEKVSLKSLILEAVNGVTVEGLEELKSMQTLRRLAVFDCPSIQGDLDSLKLQLPECEVLFQSN